MVVNSGMQLFQSVTIKKRPVQSQKPVANAAKSIRRYLPTNSLGFQIKRYNYGKILSYNVCFFVTDIDFSNMAN